MNLKRLLITTALATVLSACGGGSNNNNPEPPPPTTVTLNGKVADGYLVGAKVCLDLNSNKVCDTGEPSATTGAGGSFSLSAATQQQLDSFPLLVEVAAGTMDEDTGAAIVKGYTLTAPAGYNFVSPLSTMVLGEMDQGASQDDAEARLKALLGTSMELSDDYVAGQNNDSLTEEQRDAFERLHQVAQVTARVIANNLAQIQEAAAAAGISTDDLVALIVDTLVNALDTIVAQVQAAVEAGGEFDPDAVAGSDEVEGAAGVSGENLEDQVALLHAEANAAAANLVAEVSGNGIFWFDGEVEEAELSLEYGGIQYDATNQTTTETRYELLNGQFVVHSSDEFDMDDFVLTDNGWQATTEKFVISGLNQDGTITLSHPDFPSLSETLSATEYALAGLNTRLLLSKQENTWAWHKVMPESVSFSEGAKAFAIKATTDHDQYRLFLWDGCGDNGTVEGMCNSVWARMADGTEGPALTLASMVSATASDGSADHLVGPYVAWHDDMNILAELIEGGTVKYHKLYWMEDGMGMQTRSAMLYATGTWRTVTQSGQTLFLLALPDAVRHFGDHEMEDMGEILFAELQNAVRIGAFIPAGAGHDDDDEIIFNQTAKDDIVNNLDFTLFNGGIPPADFVCDSGNTQWDDSSGGPIVDTLKSLTQYRELVAGCRGDAGAMAFTAGMLTGYQFKEYDSEGNLETLILFNENGGSFTDYMVDPAETTDFSWSINDLGEIVVEVSDGNGGVAMRAYLSLLGKYGDYVSIKGFNEESDWAPMDGSVGEVWSDKWLRLAQ
ncbi:hypothetical protein [Shewanella cyperi]|uniref:hypothetical protein n=1 Tax=Shewanella cyperi TaxID=2814292 RepID=UPI001A951318|nr:hypothetical protein [Shewanella cyperi]QSX41120.1 hypothetical protein JYB84_01380 [Shewanella cyperi]